MRLDSLFYRLAYRFGRPRWDTTEPRPELAGLLQGRRPGRALDLGCGTGTDAIYLASHGWEVTGVDFVPEAITTARTRARAAGSTANFVAGDVTRLRQAGRQLLPGRHRKPADGLAPARCPGRQRSRVAPPLRCRFRPRR
jgi:SAM-dependent methyltransferase